MRYEMVVWSNEEEPLVSPPVAAQLARITPELLRWCDQQGLVRPRLMRGGGYGYGPAEVRQLARIRRLREQLGLDLRSVDVVLHLRRQVLDLQRQMDELEREMLRRERELLAEIEMLRRQLAVEAGWHW